MRVSKTTLHTIIGSSFTVILLTFISLASVAQQAAVKENSREMRVKYLEGTNEALLFNLKYNNDSGHDFKLMVVNETGDVLFQNNYSGKNFKKKIKLARLTDTDGVTFLIRSPKEDVQLSYKVKVPNKVVDITQEESEE